METITKIAQPLLKPSFMHFDINMKLNDYQEKLYRRRAFCV